jgi:hypothetical protein
MKKSLITLATLALGSMMAFGQSTSSAPTPTNDQSVTQIQHDANMDRQQAEKDLAQRNQDARQAERDKQVINKGEDKLKEDRAQMERDQKAGDTAAVARDKAQAERDRHDLKVVHAQEAHNAEKAKMEQKQINQQKQDIRTDRHQARVAKSGK